MQFIIMCGGKYDIWSTPRQLTKINGETLVARTIRLLRDNGVTDIAISSNLDIFNDYDFGVPIISHQNSFRSIVPNKKSEGYWVDGFYPSEQPTCYLFGDVVFSDNAIKTIVETETTDIEFFASAPPFSKEFHKKWAEPFAFKVVDTDHFVLSINRVKELTDAGAFRRHPIAWELWQVIKDTPINKIDYTNYTVINDYTCDIDEPEDVKDFEGVIL